jgi:hypothetical protein
MRRVFFVVVAALTTPALAAGQSWRDISMSRQLRDNDPVRVYVEYGAGQFNVRSIDEGVLYRMNLHYDEDAFEPVADFSGDRLRLGIESIRRRINLRGRQSGTLDLELARGVPMDLDLEFGAVRANIDLGGLALTDLDISTGASESTIDISEPNTSRIETASFEIGAAEFTALHLGNLNAERIEVDAGVGSITLALTGRWQRDAHLAIDIGLGTLELRVPEGLGIRLRKDSFLTSLDSEGLVKHGDVYESLDYDTADRKVTIDLDAAFGSVKVVWVRSVS